MGDADLDGEYDVIVLGTGLKECVLSGLMSVEGKKVLHIDRNNYYGGESASLNLDQIYEKCKKGEKAPATLGRARDYNVDLCPKFLMGCGNIVKILLKMKATRYLDFKAVAGSYALQDGKVYKVPATPGEAAMSGLMSFMQKRKFKNFLQYVNAYDPKNPKTHEGFDWTKVSLKTIYDYYGLDVNTQQFTGHAIALEIDDRYLNRPAKETMEKIKLYAYSLNRYEISPYIYPVYGLGGLPESFSRLSAIHGGTYILNAPFKGIDFNSEGKVEAVRYMWENTDHRARSKMVICDPSYVAGTDRVKLTHRVVRSICILSHPIQDTSNAESCQIIIPAHQVKGRNSDIYISVTSGAHCVCPQGRWVAVVSTNLEGKDEKSELDPAVRVLGKIDEQFTWVTDYFVPTVDPKTSQLFVTSSYDATSHFETATDEILSLYKQILEKDMDLTISAEPDDIHGGGE